MKRSIASLKAACKSLRFVLEETVPEGPDRDEAMAHLRSLFYIGKEAIINEADAVDQLVAEHFREEAEGRLVHDPEAGEPVVCGTLITVSHVVALVSEGVDEETILRTHPELDRDDLLACLLHDAEAA